MNAIIIGVPGEEREKGAESLLEEITAKTFLNLRKEMDTQNYCSGMKLEIYSKRKNLGQEKFGRLKDIILKV